MKGLFVRPRYSHVYSRFKLGCACDVVPPLGYPYLASYLEANGHKIGIIDGDVERLDKHQIVNQVLALNPDFVGIGAATPEFTDSSYIKGLTYGKGG